METREAAGVQGVKGVGAQIEAGEGGRRLLGIGGEGRVQPGQQVLGGGSSVIAEINPEMHGAATQAVRGFAQVGGDALFKGAIRTAIAQVEGKIRAHGLKGRMQSFQIAGRDQGGDLAVRQGQSAEHAPRLAGGKQGAGLRRNAMKAVAAGTCVGNGQRGGRACGDEGKPDGEEG